MGILPEPRGNWSRQIQKLTLQRDVAERRIAKVVKCLANKPVNPIAGKLLWAHRFPRVAARFYETGPVMPL